MGYKINVSVSCLKAVDYTVMSGVKLLVYHEGESLSILTMTSDDQGFDFQTVDRSHWQETEAKRIKAYAEKSGFVTCCVKAHYEGKIIDPYDVQVHNYFLEVLIIEAEPEVLPPPILMATP